MVPHLLILVSFETIVKFNTIENICHLCDIQLTIYFDFYRTEETNSYSSQDHGLFYI